MQPTIISTLTSKSQTVIPKTIRAKMGLKPGDSIRYSVKGERVEIEKLAIPTGEDWQGHNPFAAFTEWASEADEKAFAHLQKTSERAYRAGRKKK